MGDREVMEAVSRAFSLGEDVRLECLPRPIAEEFVEAMNKLKSGKVCVDARTPWPLQPIGAQSFSNAIPCYNVCRLVFAGSCIMPHPFPSTFHARL
jgi:hypothetical protein